MRYAILIDAGFLKRKLGSQAEPLDIHRVCEFLGALRTHEALAGKGLYRVYWYDAPPLDSRVTKPLLGGTINLGATSLARTNAALLADLCEVPYVSVRLGLDIAAITLKGHADVLVLVAGDSDFVPAMKFARREGAQVFLVTLGHSVRAEMLEHSDLIIDVPVRAVSLVSTDLLVRKSMDASDRA